VCAGCGQWPVWPAAPGPWRERIRGGTAGLRRSRRCAVQIDSLYRKQLHTHIYFMALPVAEM